MIISIFIYISLIVSIVGIVYIVLGLVIGFFLHGLRIGHIRNNGVKLTEKQFSNVFDILNRLSKEMGLKKVPAVYVIQSDGILNAFATRFFGRNMVVIYSNLFEIIKTGHEDELAFVLAHELAHIRRNHVGKQMLIFPAMWVPFLGSAYSRACEYTCDRMAAAYTGKGHKAIQGLMMLAIGPALLKDVDVDEYLLERSKENGFFLWLSHVTSTHPPLPLRIGEIQEMSRFPQLYGYETNLFEVNNAPQLM
ncbi:M48 family peptidase [Cohnella luojiensis]|uniref:M48 family peptidase n=1 Tax=Cohnella luojiensis TaxID=652876 RepID=A0A4Y8LUY7_9BACL|nr:M48 family peptidase [Cohnella luojiensis]